MNITIEPSGTFSTNQETKLSNTSNSTLEHVLTTLYTQNGLSSRSEYLSAIGKTFSEMFADKAQALRYKYISRKYRFQSLIAKETILPPANELPELPKVLVYFANDKQIGITPEDIVKVVIQSPRHNKRIPIRTVQLHAKPDDNLDLRIKVIFMLSNNNMITDDHFTLPDKFFNNLTAQKLDTWAAKSTFGEPYIFPARKRGCDHFINIYPVKESAAGNKYRILELGWRTSTRTRSGWKWKITAAGGVDNPVINPWIMVSKAIRAWKVFRTRLQITNILPQQDKSIIRYQRDINDIDVTPLITASIFDHIMQYTPLDRNKIVAPLFKAGRQCIPAYCHLCIYNRSPNDWETAGNDRTDGGLWNLSNPLIQRSACIIKNYFLDWDEVREINAGTQNSETYVTNRGSSVWISEVSKMLSGKIRITNGMIDDATEATSNGLDFSTFWEDDPTLHLDNLDDRPYELDDPSAPWNDTIEDNIYEDDYSNDFSAEAQLSREYGTPMSFHKRGTAYDSIYQDMECLPKIYEDKIPLTLEELTDDHPDIAKLEINVIERSEFAEAYGWIDGHIQNNVKYCNYFHGKALNANGYRICPGYAVLNNYRFGNLLTCNIFQK